MKSKITLKELAKLLNVSVSTVSKALHDSPEISPKTIERVKEAANLHHYRPNPVAVNLKKSTTGTIGVVIPNIANSFFAKVLSGIEGAARKKEIQVITYISNESLSREKQICEMLTSGLVDGVLIAVSEETQRKGEYDHLFNIVDYGIPLVLYDRINVEVPADKVGVDDEQSFVEATKYFRNLGVKKIGLASAILHLGVGKLRIKGYEKAMNGLQVIDLAASSRPEVLKEKIRNLILKDKAEVVLCTDFESTLMVSRIAYEEGLTIPKDLKILGYVTKDVAEFMTPSISYIEQHPAEVGAKAFELLDDRINVRLDIGKYEEPIIATSMVHLESTKI